MMANRFKGEVAIDCEGSRYTLRMDMLALAAFEDATGENALSWAEAAEGGQAAVGDMIEMIRCTLARHHPEADYRLAGDILSEDPGVLLRLFRAASPELAQDEPEDGPEDGPGKPLPAPAAG
ncbi:GTA-gp10 family protein [Rhodovulum sulfidophilum]|uniref:GTA-gp10 family protein n=1 Tax=Rhodovulum sulfidophilum TaxID=35806 RepID=UPI001F46F4F6|nr:GTA-gp10 family protein [Rhodovulum sulfidophilum]